MPKPGSYSKDLSRASLRRWLTGFGSREKLMYLALLAAIGTAPVGMFLLFDRKPTAWAWWFSGWSIGIFFGITHHIASLASGAANRQLGALGEEWTAAWLAERPNTALFHGLKFSELADTDHLAIGRSGVFVVETKTTSHEWTVHDGRLIGPIKDVLGPLEKKARSAGLFLRQFGVGQVHPVLVIWDRSPLSPGREVIGGVQVVWGRHPGSAGSIRGSTVSNDAVTQAIDHLAAMDVRQNNRKRS